MLYTSPKTDTLADDFSWLSSQWTETGFAQGSVKIPANSLIRLDISGSAATDLTPLANLVPNLIDRLDFDIHDADLTGQFEHIGKLTGLKFLSFRSCPLTDASIAQLANLTNLESLTCSNYSHRNEGYGITDESLKIIAKFPRLKRLHLRSNPITDEGLVWLATCNALETLDLSDTNVTGTGLDSLLMLPNLKSLRFGTYDEGAPVDDEGMRVLGQLTQLEHLDLSGTKVTDAGMQHVV